MSFRLQNVSFCLSFFRSESLSLILCLPLSFSVSRSFKSTWTIDLCDSGVCAVCHVSIVCCSV